jgi:hypothetical protein
MDECKLRAANEIHGVECDGEWCTYWRLVDQLDVPVASEARSGCAIQYFRLLDGESAGVAQWLLSVKERLESGAGHGVDPADQQGGARG